METPSLPASLPTVSPPPSDSPVAPLSPSFRPRLAPGRRNAPRARIAPRTRAAPLLALLLALCTLLLSALPARAQDAVHVVVPGDQLGKIARKYGVPVDELIAYNNISNPNVIAPGQRLLIPNQAAGALAMYGTPADESSLPAGNGYYTVRRGDTLSSIAERYEMSAGDLMRLNGLTNANFVWVGQQLRLSARVEPALFATDEAERSDLAEEIYVVGEGDTLSEIAQRFGVSTQELLAANGLPNANFVWVGQRLRVKPSLGGTGGPATYDVAYGVAPDANAPADGRRWIEVNLTDQTLTAWQGDVAIIYTTISSGLPGTPTVTGWYQIGTKYQAQRMTGPGYDLPGVPWVMYFYGSYAIHGAYWHNNFGTPMSRGCVNMRVDEAQFLYNWAPAGTEVYVHY